VGKKAKVKRGSVANARGRQIGVHGAGASGFGQYVMAWLRLVRIEHALLSAAGVGAAILITQRVLGPLSQCYCTLVSGSSAMECSCVEPAVSPFVWLAALATPFFINIAAFALNDYFDVEADRRNGRKDRPLVSGALSARAAVLTAALGYVLGVLAAFAINPLCGAIATLFAALSIAYNAKLKDWPLVGNAYIALSMAIAFPFGAFAVGIPLLHLPYSIVWLTYGAFAAGVSREIVKSVQDMAGDREARGSLHLPILIGRQKSLWLAAGLGVIYAACIIKLAQRPLWGNLLFFAGLFISAVAYLMLSLMMVRHPNAKRIELIRKMSLAALGIALLTVLLSVILSAIF